MELPLFPGKFGSLEELARFVVHIFHVRSQQKIWVCVKMGYTMDTPKVDGLLSSG